jgi:hypothetical protein
LKGKVEIPYRRRFSQPVWYRDQPAFPEGLDPYRDLFQEGVIGELIKNSGHGGPIRRIELQSALRDIANDYLYYALTTPLGIDIGPKDVSLSDRAEWIETRILRPLELLLDALSPPNAHMLSEFPEGVDSTPPSYEELIHQLNLLGNWTWRLRNNLSERASTRRSNHTMDFLNSLCYDLTISLSRFFPSLKISIGTYSPEDDQYHSRYIFILKQCVKEILGDDGVVSINLIKQIVREFRRSGQSQAKSP